MGDIVYVEIESVGEELEEQNVFVTVEAVKTVSDLFMPLNGEVLEFNTALEDTPEAVNEDPYESGWMIKIKIQNPDQLNELLDADQYKSLIEA